MSAPVETVRTACNRDCPDACTLLADVVDGRVTRLRGDPGHPVTQGFLCYRTARFLEHRQYSRDRLLYPLARASWLAIHRGQADERAPLAIDPLVRAPWDEVLGFVARDLIRIRAESSPAAIMLYRSGGSLGVLKHLADLLFERFGPVTLKRGDICSGAGEEAQTRDLGIADSHSLADLKHSRQIILWGKNPHVSSVHLLPLLQAAKRRGAGIILIDPVHHRGAALADRYLQPRPGGDLSLAMAVASLVFDDARCPSDLDTYVHGIERLRALASSKDVHAWLHDADVSLVDATELAHRLLDGPCATLVGWGMQRRTQGGAIVRAVTALAAISGNLGRAGGGASFYFQRKAGFDLDFLQGPKAAPRTLEEARLGAELLQAADPPVRALWITCGNPVAMLPDSACVAAAIESRELCVVVDSHETDTTRRATVVLPCATMLEEEDLLGAYGHHYLQSQRQAVAPPAQVRGELEILQDLAERLGCGEALAGGAREWKRRILAPAAALGAPLEAVEAGAVRRPGAPEVLFSDRFPTPSGKVEVLQALPPEPPAALPGFDLHLLSGSTKRSQSSQWSDPRTLAARATVHPETGAARGLTDGAPVLVSSPLGSLRMHVRFDAQQRRDVVIVPKGGHFDEGACANALIEARTTDIGGGAAYQSCFVQIAPADTI